MTDKKDADPRFSEVEINLLSKLNEGILKLFRKVFFQEVLEEKELKLLKDILSPELIKVLKRFFTPDLDWNEPIFMSPNRWGNPPFEQMLVNETRLAVIGRQMGIEFLEKGVQRLGRIMVGDNSVEFPEVDLRMKREYRKVSPEETKIQAIAMQTAVKELETALFALYRFTIPKESPEETAKRQKKDSTR